MVHDNTGKNVAIGRRDFLSGAAAFAMVGGMAPMAMCEEGEDWKTAFLSHGFDPDATGSSWFVVTSDIHAEKHHGHLAAHVAEWNAMDPKPELVCALGDFGYLNDCFGHRPSPQKAAESAERQFGAVNAILSDGLSRDVRRAGAKRDLIATDK